MASTINAKSTGSGGLDYSGDASGVLGLQTGGVTAVTIDTSQNVGIGTTSPTFAAGTGLQVKGSGDTNVRVSNNSYTGIDLIKGSDGTSYLWNRDNTSLLFGTNNAERMRIDSSGNVGIGRTSLSYKFEVNDTSLLSQNAGSTTGSVGTALALDSKTSGAYATGQGSALNFQITNSSGAQAGCKISSIHNADNNTAYLAFYPRNYGYTEAMRIDSSGNLLIGQTSNANGARIAITGNGGGTTDDLTFNSTSTTSDIQSYNSKPLCLNRYGNEVWINGGTDRGSYALQVNSTGVWGAGAYVNGSDERIKDNIAPIDSGLDVVAKLNPVTYKYKEDWSKDQSTQTGFIAQELLVALEGKNYIDGVVQQGGEYMSVAYQNIIPILTKAIQEQQELIKQLQADVAALKGAN